MVDIKGSFYALWCDGFRIASLNDIHLAIIEIFAKYLRKLFNVCYDEDSRASTNERARTRLMNGSTLLRLLLDSGASTVRGEA